METTANLEVPEDLGTDDPADAKRWCIEIEQYEKSAKDWETKGVKITKRYKDERETVDKRVRFNILWSNVETLKPAIYARAPQPEVMRRFKDKDRVGKLASEVLERCLSYQVDTNNFDQLMESVTLDYLLPGRGTAWVRYDGTDLQDERAPIDYIHWTDFGHTPARVWSEVTAVWKKAYLTRKELIATFGEDVGKKIKLDFSPKEFSREELQEEHQTFKKATIYEIWDKGSRTVIWIHKEYEDGPLKKISDPLGLVEFFPCPRPLYTT
jgi:hypothetical protein